MLIQIGANPLKQTHAKLLVGHFAPSKSHGDFGFVAFFKKANQIAQLDVVVAVIGTRTKLDFLDLNRLS